MSSISRLARVLKAGRFAVTAECGPPPQGADLKPIQEKGKLIKDVVDAV
ncbi:MAG: methylenetetrahydrofolate reductase, partial [Deltaproteobacteria bacterium]|nr:methylenetetrahydrofolate reductase [Deltaproteobacteria bacterium]